MNLAEIGAFIAVFISLLSIIVQWQRDRNKPRVDDATASQVNTSANIALVAPLTDRINALEQELENERDIRRASISNLRAQFDSLLRGSWENYEQLKENNIAPRYTPPREFKSGPLAVK